MGYGAKNASKMQKATIIARPTVIVTMTWADLQALYSSDGGGWGCTIDNLPIGDQEGRGRSPLLTTHHRCNRFDREFASL